MTLEIAPGRAVGTVTVPPSKSYTHRALVGAASLGLELTIRHPLDADDTRRTRAALEQLGYRISATRTAWTVRRRTRVPEEQEIRIDCGESGTTLRFVAALAARDDRPVRFTGRPRLARRPMAELEEALRKLGATVRRPADGGWPLRIQGPIRAGNVRLRLDRSSQFASALLLTLAGLKEPSRIEASGRRVSRSYLEATRATLRFLGAEIRPRGEGWTVGGPRRRPAPGSFPVPGDASSAAYLWVAAAVSHGRVTTLGLDRRWPQADRRMLRLLHRSGAQVVERARSATVRGVAHRPFRVELDDAPDLLPLAAALAVVAPGRSVLSGAAHAEFKESDRRAATAQLARGFGAAVRLGSRRIEIRATGRLRSAPACRSLDHRVVASHALAALAGDRPVRILHPGALAKSYPGFWRDLRRLGIGVRELP